MVIRKFSDQISAFRIRRAFLRDERITVNLREQITPDRKGRLPMKKKAAAILGILLAATAGVAAGSGAMSTAVTAAPRATTAEAAEDTTEDTTDDTDSDDTEEDTEEDTEAVTAAALESGKSVISVTGSETVKVRPDRARVQFSIETQADTAKKAQSENDDEINELVDTLEDLGVSDDDITTSNYSLYPKYDYSDGGDGTIVGYTLNCTLLVDDQDADGVNAIIAGCSDAGITSISGLEYYCDDDTDSYNDALKKAIADARTKAEAVAEATDSKLGSIVSITETTDGNTSEPDTYYNFESKDAIAESVTIFPDDVDVTAKVTVVYSVR